MTNNDLYTIKSNQTNKFLKGWLQQSLNLLFNEMLFIEFIWLSIANHHHLVVPSAWISLTLFHHPSLSLIVSGFTPYPHRAAVCKFELVALLLLGHVKGSIGVPRLWTRLYFSSSVPHVWSSNFDNFRDG